MRIKKYSILLGFSYVWAFLARTKKRRAFCSKTTLTYTTLLKSKTKTRSTLFQQMVKWPLNGFQSI